MQSSLDDSLLKICEQVLEQEKWTENEDEQIFIKKVSSNIETIPNA